MAITTKDEAVAVAQENSAIDAAKYERLIEAFLMTWDGVSECRIDIPGRDHHVVPYLMAELKQAGYTVRAIERSNVAKDWWFYFK